MATRKKKAPETKAPAPDAQPSTETSVEGGALAAIESGADTTRPRDPARAAEQLSVMPDESDTAADTGSKEPAAPPKSRGRPAGSRNGTGKRSRSGTPRATRAQLAERAEAAESRLAALEAQHAPDRAQQEAELAAALGGTVAMMTDMYIGGKPEREGWRWTDDEVERWGTLWAGPLLPHMPALGAAAPWVMAAFGTGKLVMDKARAARVVAQAVADASEGTPAKVTAESEGN